MKKLIAALCVVFTAGLPSFADTADLYGRADGVKWPSLSPTGDLLAVHCSPQGQPSVCIFNIAKGEDVAFIPLGGEVRLQGFYWPSDDYLIINVSTFKSLQTVDGQRDYNFLQALSYDIDDNELNVLLNDEGLIIDAQSVVSVLPGDDRNVMMAAVTANTGQSEHSLGSISPDRGGTAWSIATFKTRLDNGKSRRERTLLKSTLGAWFDAEGDVVAEIVSPDRSTRRELRSNNRTLFTYDSASANDFAVLGLDQASGKLIIFRDVGDEDGLYFMSLEDGSMEPVRIAGVDVGRASPVRDTYTRGIVGFEYFDGMTRQVFTDPVLSDVLSQLSGALGGKRVNIESWNRDRSKIAISAAEPGRPADYYVFDRGAGALGPIGSAASHLAEATTGQVVTREIRARDGLQVETFLTLPPGRTLEDGPFPTVIMPHGGPEARDGLGYDWWAQALAAEGYLVIQPNFRGSSGYGQDFRNAGFGEFGGKMIDDIADAGAWAVSQGLVAGDAYCVAGASYGGYAALMMGLKDKARSRCLISVNGVTQPFAHVGAFALDSETGQYWERYLGLNRFDSEAERAVISPVARAGEYDQPILILHAENDLVVRTGQARLIASELDGKPGFRSVSLGEADHYIGGSDVRAQVLRETFAFLNRNHPAR
jgi:dipeptidyl aminopeptidase/acylaminoacyl peptidase